MADGPWKELLLKTIAQLSSVLILSLAFTHAASALPQAPQSVGALGDSVTAGSLARYRRDSAESWMEFVKASSSSTPTSFPELTWATGSEPKVEVNSQSRNNSAKTANKNGMFNGITPKNKTEKNGQANFSDGSNQPIEK